MKLIGWVLLSLTVLFWFWWSNQPELKFEAGRDSYESFGDGTYMLYRNGCNFVKNKCIPEKTLTLYDNQNLRTIQVGIVSYQEISSLPSSTW